MYKFIKYFILEMADGFRSDWFLHPIEPIIDYIRRRRELSKEISKEEYKKEREKIRRIFYMEYMDEFISIYKRNPYKSERKGVNILYIIVLIPILLNMLWAQYLDTIEDGEGIGPILGIVTMGCLIVGTIANVIYILKLVEYLNKIGIPIFFILVATVLVAIVVTKIIRKTESPIDTAAHWLRYGVAMLMVYTGAALIIYLIMLAVD